MPEEPIEEDKKPKKEEEEISVPKVGVIAVDNEEKEPVEKVKITNLDKIKKEEPEIMVPKIDIIAIDKKEEEPSTEIKKQKTAHDKK